MVKRGNDLRVGECEKIGRQKRGRQRALAGDVVNHAEHGVKPVKRAGPVAIADVRGEGVAQVVVPCADGHVYGIGPESLASP